LLALVGAGCTGLRREPWVLDSGDLSAGPVRRGAWIASYPQALATAIDALEGLLGPPALEVRVVFLPDRATFEALLLEVGYPPHLAANAAAEMRAIGGYRHVLVNESRLSRLEWPQVTALFVHELVHVLQYELGGGVRGQSEQWVREGLAEWVEVQALEQLQVITSATEVRRLALAHVRSIEPDAVPALTVLATFPEWVEQGRRRKELRLYDLALAAVDVLVEKTDLAAVHDYFARFAHSQDREQNFAASFGRSLDAFDGEFRRHVWPD
jgi:hypothetical protein